MILKAVMQIYSYVFHALLALFLLAVCALGLASGSPVSLDMLPLSGKTLAWSLSCASLFGLITVLLALKGTARFLFFLWSVVVFVMLVRGYFLTPYHFENASSVHTGIYLTVGSLLAVFGAWFQLRRVRAGD